MDFYNDYCLLFYNCNNKNLQSFLNIENMEKSLGQKIFYTCIALVMLIALVPVLWYGYIAIFGGEKFTSSTFHLNQLKDVEGNVENILKIKYYSNANKNGLECFDLKFSYFTDENQEQIYYQGMQYIANSKTDKIQWYTPENIIGNNGLLYQAELADAYDSYEIKENKGFLGITTSTYFAGYVSPFVNSKTTGRYAYQSLSDSFDTLISTNPLDEESYLTLQAGEELIYLKFKSHGYAHEKGKYLDEYKPIGECKLDYFFSRGNIKYYENFGIDYLSYQIYNAIQTLPAGTKGQRIIELSDVFKYYKCDADKSVGTEISSKDHDLIKNYMKTYFAFEVEVSADGLQEADDSMFKSAHGSPSYKLDGATGEHGDYFTGRPIIELNHTHFDKVLIKGNNYAFKLREDILNAYLPYRKQIALKVVIDQNELSQEGITYIGFTADSGLENFVIDETEIISIAEVVS